MSLSHIRIANKKSRHEQSRRKKRDMLRRRKIETKHRDKLMRKQILEARRKVLANRELEKQYVNNLKAEVLNEK